MPTHTSASQDAFAGWLREHAVALSGLDPDAALDELEPLADAIGDARVVAIGESAHFVREFTLARERITRFLAERCGFTVFAFEFGFSEAFAVDRWVQGAGAVEDLAQVSETASAWGAGDLLGFLRRHNATSDHRLRFVGVDIPEAGGSLLPALDPVADFLRDVDLEAVPDLERAIAIAGRFASGSGASAAPAWAQLQASEQDALTATLARLLRRFHALEPVYVARSDQQAYEIALHRLRAAGHADGMFPAMAALFAGTGVPGELSVRDYYMAETVRWHLDHADPGTRIVLASHNNHIQRTAVAFNGQFTNLPMGQYLARALGDGYYAVGLTTTDDHVPEMQLDERSPTGFRIVDAPMEPP
jgi:erythromycin esterase